MSKSKWVVGRTVPAGKAESRSEYAGVVSVQRHTGNRKIRRQGVRSTYWPEVPSNQLATPRNDSKN
jgi:hypothetical protein